MERIDGDIGKDAAMHANSVPDLGASGHPVSQMEFEKTSDFVAPAHIVKALQLMFSIVPKNDLPFRPARTPPSSITASEMCHCAKKGARHFEFCQAK